MYVNTRVQLLIAPKIAELSVTAIRNCTSAVTTNRTATPLPGEILCMSACALPFLCLVCGNKQLLVATSNCPCQQATEVAVQAVLACGNKQLVGSHCEGQRGLSPLSIPSSEPHSTKFLSDSQ